MNFSINFKRLLVGICSVALLYLGNILYFQTQQLDGPFFLKHYYDVKVNENGMTRIELYYVTNKQEQILNVFIPGMDFTRVSYDGVYQDFPHYQIKKAVVEVDRMNKEEVLTHTKLDVQFAHAGLIEYEIGEIIFRLSITTDTETESPVRFLAAGSSSDYTGYSLFEMVEPVQLVEIDFPFHHALKDELHIFVDFDNDDINGFKEKLQSSELDEEMEEFVRKHMWNVQGIELNNLPLPIAFEKNDSVKVNSAFMFDETSLQKHSVYEFSIRLLFETEDGMKTVVRSHLNYQPYFSNRDIRELAKRVGEPGE